MMHDGRLRVPTCALATKSTVQRTRGDVGHAQRARRCGGGSDSPTHTSANARRSVCCWRAHAARGRALFGYDKSNALHVVGSGSARLGGAPAQGLGTRLTRLRSAATAGARDDGHTDGGVTELAEEVNDGKIEYAYLRVTDDNTGLPKLVFISWVRAREP